jgi:tripartite-type tricarboxylate transporter receptor subunit TctC
MEMKRFRKQVSRMMFLATLIVALIAGPALAQEKFPSNPVNIVVPFAAGGNTAINAQLLRPSIQKTLGASVEIILKPGGSTTIGTNVVANSPPDGYTLLAHTPSLLCTQYTVKTGVNAEKFTPVLRSVAVPMGIAVKFDAPWKTFKEFIEDAKTHPGKITMGNSGIGAMTHIGTTGVEMSTGVKLTHMPFKGSGPVMTALVGGHVHGAVVEISTLYPFVEAKKIRVLVVSSQERSAVLPDVPTFSEHGFDLDIGTWVTFFVPKGTPKNRIQALHEALKVAMESPEHRDHYKQQGGIIRYMNLEETAAWVDGQNKLWKKIIDFGGFKPMD